MTIPTDRSEDTDLEKDISYDVKRRRQCPNVTERVRQLVSSRKNIDQKPQHVSFAFNPQYSISTPTLSTSVPQIVVSTSPLQQSNNTQGLAQIISMPSSIEKFQTSPPGTPSILSPTLSEDNDYTPRTSIDDFDRQRKKYRPYNLDTDEEDDRMSNVDTLYGTASVCSENVEDEPASNFSCGCYPAWWQQRSKLFRKLVINLCLFVVIFLPVLVTRIVLDDDYTILSIPIDRWTEFLCLVIFGLHLARLLVFIVLKTIWYCTAGKAKTRVEMLHLVQVNIAICMWSLACLSGWHYIIKVPYCQDNQCDEINLYTIIGNALESIVFGSFAFCFERIALTQVSTIFKKGAYHDRVIQCRFEADMIEAMLKCRHIDKVEKKIAKMQSRRPSVADIYDIQPSNGSLRHNFGSALKSQPDFPSQLVQCSSNSQFGNISMASRISVELEDKLKKSSKAGIEVPECLLDATSGQYGERQQWNINITQMTKYIRQIRSKKLLNAIGSIEDANKYAKKIFFRLCPRNRIYIVKEDFQRVFHSRRTQEFVFQLLDNDMDGKITLSDMREGRSRHQEQYLPDLLLVITLKYF